MPWPGFDSFQISELSTTALVCRKFTFQLIVSGQFAWLSLTCEVPIFAPGDNAALVGGGAVGDEVSLVLSPVKDLAGQCVLCRTARAAFEASQALALD